MDTIQKKKLRNDERLNWPLIQLFVDDVFETAWVKEAPTPRTIAAMYGGPGIKLRLDLEYGLHGEAYEYQDGKWVFVEHLRGYA